MAANLSLAESGALMLDDAATALDGAKDSTAFLQALERNREVWRTLKDVAEQGHWSVPDRRQTEFALGTATRVGVSDGDVSALVDINRSVSAALAGGDIDGIRERAYFIWESRGRPHGQAMDHWLLAEMQTLGPKQ
jgi:Protein of unknown function (DUF2934)